MAIRLLLVDGDPTVQHMAEQACLSLGLDFSSFEDALTGLDAIGRLKPKLVIADYRLTGATFISFCERIAGMELAPQPPIVALVGPEDQFDEAELRFLGVKTFERKPIEPDHLTHTIRQLCGDLGLAAVKPAEEEPGESAPGPLSHASSQTAAAGAWMTLARSSSRSLSPASDQTIPAMPPASADLAELISREIGRQLPLMLQAELPNQIAKVYPREDMTLIAIEAVQQALPDISHQLIADLKPMIEDRVADIAKRVLQERLDKRS
ncbi:MAG: response regulator [Nitrospiraceae bacterium]